MIKVAKETVEKSVYLTEAKDALRAWSSWEFVVNARIRLCAVRNIVYIDEKRTSFSKVGYRYSAETRGTTLYYIYIYNMHYIYI